MDLNIEQFCFGREGPEKPHEAEGLSAHSRKEQRMDAKDLEGQMETRGKKELKAEVKKLEGSIGPSPNRTMQTSGARKNQDINFLSTSP